ncbi:hypothetical protein [Arthrobacter sp. Y81]|uniref:hypothetical protein n=1 Tax=Arthrobacter sp. Y81 TaxID=2058897 RepID=UPI0015E2FA2E|nr:hypothetical protein [Arthrobacter sp. Y81]
MDDPLGFLPDALCIEVQVYDYVVLLAGKLFENLPLGCASEALGVRPYLDGDGAD